MICKSVEEFIIKYLYEGYSISDLKFESNELYRDLIDLCEKSENIDLNRVAGTLYYIGKGVKRNSKKAIKIFEKHACTGDLISQYNLAVIYDKEKNEKNNLEKALYWYTKAADQGNAFAQYNLAIMYQQGKGTTRNLEKSFYWFEKAAEQGYIHAQYNLAIMYQQGEGTKKDLEKSFYWFEKAANQGDVESQIHIAQKYYEGEGTSKNLSNALFWYTIAANQEHVIAQYNLAIIYDENDDLENAIYWYTKAANQGYAQAQTNLGLIYCSVGSSIKDLKKGFYWFKEAANQGYAQAQYSLGVMYYNGKGTTRNFPESLYWFKEAANQGYAQAQYNLALLYKKGDGVVKDLNKSLYWAELSYSNGLEFARELIDNLKKKIEIEKSKNKLHLCKRKDVFISWNHDDKNIKDEIYIKLEKDNLLTVWESDGDGNGDIDEIIQDAIKQAKSYLIILTKNSIKSKWVKKEIDLILDIVNDTNFDHKVIPLVIDNEVIDLIKQFDENDSFKKIINKGTQFTYKGRINYDSLTKVIKDSIEKTIIIEYKDKIINQNNKFIGALTNVIKNENTKSGIISVALDFETSYINRNVYINEVEYKIEDILNNKYSLIYGEGGIGKTLYLKHILRNYFINNRFIFNIVCNTINTNENISFIEMLKENAINKNFPEDYQISRCGFERVFNSSNEILILVDALDEINENDKKILLTKIREFNNKYLNVKYIFTSRSKEDTLLLEKHFNYNVNCYKLRGLNDEDMDKLFNVIKEKYVVNESDNTGLSNLNINSFNKEHFFAYLKNINNDIKQNPFLISNLIHIYLATKEVPKTEYEIINKFINILVKEIDSDKDITFKYAEYLKDEKLNEILGYLTYKRAINDSSSISEIFEEYLNNTYKNLNNTPNIAKDIYNYLRRRGIVIYDNISHELFKNYFTASFIFTKSYKKDKNKFFESFYVYNDKKFFKSTLNKKLSLSNLPWPSIACNFLTKLDHEIHTLDTKTEMNEKHLSYQIFSDLLTKALKEEKYSIEAIEGVKKLINNKMLYYYEFIREYLKSNKE